MKSEQTVQTVRNAAPLKTISVADGFPSLKRVGVAVEYYPKFVSDPIGSLHTVDVVLLGFTIRGRGKHLMGNEEYEEIPGSVGITHYGQVHDIVTDNEGIEQFNVFLDLRNHTLPILPAALRDVLAIILPLHPDLCHRLNRRVHLRLNNELQIAHLLERMLYEQNLQDEASDEMMRALLGILLVELCRSALQHGLVSASSAKGKSNEWVERLRQDLDTHYREPQTLPELARRYGMHPGSLCRVFKQYTGVTLMDYINMRRIQAAMVNLRSTQDKIIKIALECGFNDLAYFNRKFRAITGKTPTQYRAEVKIA